jgi:hypothetical protein
MNNNVDESREISADNCNNGKSEKERGREKMREKLVLYVIYSEVRNTTMIGDRLLFIQ